MAETDKTAGGGLTVKYEKQPVSKYPKFESVNESNALMNWEKRMMERRKQQDHLSSKHISRSITWCNSRMGYLFGMYY